jgi:hypothetical protein
MMKQKPNEHNKSFTGDELLRKLYTQTKSQFGDAVKSFWFYDGKLCPACNHRKIDLMKIKGKEALSLNAFIYRETGTLIGYFLCSNCARRVFCFFRRLRSTASPFNRRQGWRLRKIGRIAATRRISGPTAPYQKYGYSMRLRHQAGFCQDAKISPTFPFTCSRASEHSQP